MTTRLPSWPTLLVWAAISAGICVIGVGFAGSFVPEVPPPIEYPLDFVLWLAATTVVIAPFILMVLRLLSIWRDRDNNA